MPSAAHGQATPGLVEGSSSGSTAGLAPGWTSAASDGGDRAARTDPPFRLGSRAGRRSTPRRRRTRLLRGGCPRAGILYDGRHQGCTRIARHDGAKPTSDARVFTASAVFEAGKGNFSRAPSGHRSALATFAWSPACDIPLHAGARRHSGELRCEFSCHCLRLVDACAMNLRPSGALQRLAPAPASVCVDARWSILSLGPIGDSPHRRSYRQRQ